MEELRRLLAEERAAREASAAREAALAEVLAAINASPGDPQPVFEAILSKAHRLCGATLGSLCLYDGALFYSAASLGYPPRLVEMARKPFAGGKGVRALVDGVRHVHTPDISATGEPERTDLVRGLIDIGCVRTSLHVPLRKNEALLGFISANRTEVRPFSEHEISLLESFADQAVIAIENARLLTEQREALEQQAATSEILEIINRSSDDPQPIFEAILDKAMGSCGFSSGSLWLLDGDALRITTNRGHTPKLREFLRTLGPQKPNIDHTRMMSAGRPVMFLDLREGDAYRQGEPLASAVADLGGVRSIVMVPLLKDRVFMGYISAFRTEIRPFTDKEISILENFAAQAVIAIENTRLITEQREALERQTATAELLGVINANAGNLEPVFAAILEKATELCECAFGSLHTHDGRQFHTVSTCGYTPELAAALGESVVPRPGSAFGRIADGEKFVHIADITEDETYTSGNPIRRAFADIGGARTALWVALRQDNVVLGLICVFRKEVRPFADKQRALLENFAAQAVIAMENARLITEQREALERQTATSEVLATINASPSDLRPVFESMLEKCLRLCDSAFGFLRTYDGTFFHTVATKNLAPAYAEALAQPTRAEPGTIRGSMVQGEDVVHLADLEALPTDQPGNSDLTRFAEIGGARTALWVALRKDGTLRGMFNIFRLEPRPFTDMQIALVRDFAAQAVIAMENARLITEQREALEQQTAMAEVLSVINANPGNLAKVFNAVLERACRVSGTAYGTLNQYNGKFFTLSAAFGVPAAFAALREQQGPFQPVPGGPIDRILATGHSEHILDLKETELYKQGHAGIRGLVDVGGARTVLRVPLVNDQEAVGFFSMYRQEVRPFTDAQISILENFAAQAVIAMDNARLLNEIRERQGELDVTFQSMGDGVALFDEAHRLAAWNQNFQDMLEVPGEIVEAHPSFAAYLQYLADRGEYGPSPGETVQRLRAQAGQSGSLERTRPNGQTIQIRTNPTPTGGFVIIYTDITERKRAEEALRAARDAAEAALADLRRAQDRLVQSEKMASLGQLTAGIAHEIKNPLNFVNNFSDLSADLLDELHEVLEPVEAGIEPKLRGEIEELTATLKGNLAKIAEHGRRADSIVKNMLEHSRTGASERRAVDLNATAQEALNLAYHGARAEIPGFNIAMEKDLDPAVGMVELYPQEFTRVLVNLINNGFYAARKRAQQGEAGFEPTLRLSTRAVDGQVEVRVRDNGTGIPAEVREKIFEPFFTTKPAGEGTGLGLSLSYDIITKQHGGQLAVESEPGVFTEFTITLPRRPAGASNGEGKRG